jgi:hypothetical protein
VEKKKVDYNNCGNNERDEEVKSKKPIQSRVVYCEPPPYSLHDHIPNIGNRGKKIGNNSSSSERYLPPRENIPYKSCPYN